MDDLTYAIDDGVATITLDRPQAANAWSEAMIDSMLAALERAESEPEARAIVLTGAGKHFSAGGDLEAMRDQSGMFAGDPAELRRRYARGLQAITRRFERLEIPAVAAVNGAAIGAGLDLALMCDIRVADPAAKFGSTFARVGLIPGDGGAYLLTRVAGFARAAELILTARVFAAPDALIYGVVHELTAPGRAMARAHEVAAGIARLPANAVQAAKVALYRSYNRDPQVALELTAALQGLAQRSAGHAEAVERALEGLGRGSNRSEPTK